MMILTKITQIGICVKLVEQELLFLPEHLTGITRVLFCGVRVVQSCESLFVVVFTVLFRLLASDYLNGNFKVFSYKLKKMHQSSPTKVE
jgi:hypothetical protein